MNRIQLVCFDLGGVLIQICDGWHEACQRAGLAVPDHLKKPQQQPKITDLLHRHETGQIDDHTFDTLIAQQLGLTPQQVDAIARAWLKKPYPNLDNLLDQLQHTDTPTACLSNTNRRHYHMMTQEDDSPTALPLRRLDYCFLSYQLGAIKPEPAIYEQVEKHTGLPPEAILFFDDMVENITAARQRGWLAHQIDRAGDPVSQMTRWLARCGVL